MTYAYRFFTYIANTLQREAAVTPEEFRVSLTQLNEKELRYKQCPQASLHSMPASTRAHPYEAEFKAVFPLPPGGSGITLGRQNRFAIVPLHSHDYVEMNYVYTGTATTIIDGKNVEMHVGDVSLLDTGAVHTILPLGEQDILLNFLVPISQLQGLLTRVAPQTGDVAALLWDSMNTRRDHDRYLLVHTASSPVFRNLVERAFCEQLDPAVDSDLAIECYLTLMWVELTRCWQAQMEDASRSGEHVFITEILRYMQLHCTDCTLDSVSEHFGYNPSYLSRMVSQRTGKTFKAHITEARLALAARRLRTSDESIASVAEACGYRNQTVFYQKFRERFGCTPREMRQGDAPSVSFE